MGRVMRLGHRAPSRVVRGSACRVSRPSARVTFARSRLAGPPELHATGLTASAARVRRPSPRARLCACISTEPALLRVSARARGARHTPTVRWVRQSHAGLLVGSVAVAVIGLAATSSGALANKRPPPSPPAPSTTTTTPPLPPPVQPGGSIQWRPAGGQAVGQPLLYLGSSGGASMAWMPPKLVRAAVYPGSADPGPWSVSGQVDDMNRPYLVAAFNGGFKPSDFNGTITSFGHAFRDPAPGVASFVAFADGSFTVGMWGRDVGRSPNVVAIRQNLPMLVDGGGPAAAAGSPGNWGASVGGAATMRSGIGVDANGGLVWAGGRLSPADLAAALVAGGAVRGMELDINPQ